MFQLKYPIDQSEPPRSPRETLPTMYDLPSENLKEPGLPDEFHTLQPQLLSRTCRPPQISAQQMFMGADINLYYDVRHPRWYKRPDWFLVIGVPRLYDRTDLRLSYVIWQEGVTPRLVVELLSPGTEAEDLGENLRTEDMIQLPHPEATTTQESLETLSNSESPKEPPRKWEVYEQILRVPYYVTFSRYTNQMRAFTLVADRYQEVELNREQPRLWIPALELGLGLWQGEYEGIERQWLRWYDAEDRWVLTDTEQALERAAQAEAALEQERREKERLLERLKQLEQS
ncbi:MAG: Uma2 family endonuclease [Desertifilum sp. SIO1I2]|nr:Uma2 family endonuclease [Desertifilum sp. SIO1I2]